MKKKLQTTFSTRQYMLSKDFEIYYYNEFPDYKPIVSHHHSHYEFYFFMEGNIGITIEDTAINIKPGDIIILPPGINHYPTIYDQKTPYRRFVLWISKPYIEKLLAFSSDYEYLFSYLSCPNHYLLHTDPIEFNAIQSIIFHLIEETQNERFGKQAESYLQINSLILNITRILYEHNTNISHNNEQSLYQKVIRFITAHLDEDLSLERIAKEFYVSKYHIAHAFKENMGISVHQYITKKRLHSCRDALLSSLPISKIYEQYGFRDYTSFFRSFKKEYGISPKEYREMYLIS